MRLVHFLGMFHVWQARKKLLKILQWGFYFSPSFTMVLNVSRFATAPYLFRLVLFLKNVTPTDMGSGPKHWNYVVSCARIIHRRDRAMKKPSGKSRNVQQQWLIIYSFRINTDFENRSQFETMEVFLNVAIRLQANS